MTSPPITDYVRRGLESFELTIAERDELRRQCHRLRVDLARVQGHNDELRQTDALAQAELAHYRHLTSELSTALEIAGQTVLDALNKARQGPYRKNGDIPRKMVEDVEVPSFLLENGRNDEKG